MGTMHEVGYWEGAIDENSPCNPASLYGIAKNALRETTFPVRQAHGAVAQWIRAYYIVGDDKFGNSIFSKLLAAAEEGEPPSPSPRVRTATTSSPCTSWPRRSRRSWTRPRSPASSTPAPASPMSLAERVEAYIRDNDLDITLEYGAFPDRPYDSPGVWGDPTKIRQILATVDGTGE